MDTLSADISTVTDARQSFFNTMAALQADFCSAEDDISRREGALQRALAAMQATMQEGIGKSVLADNHKLSAIVENFNGKLNEIWDDWHKRLEAHDRRTSFRRGLTDSLVVFVLGKVKAGKSSLGNYVAYGTSTPQPPSPPSQAVFFTETMANDAESGVEHAEGQGGHFVVGARETTRTIQGFRLPGLTWVDAPGLHSVTRDNGALASDYAAAADIIIYPTASDSPGRADDIKEIKDLLTSGKRFLVLITQADIAEEEEDDEGNIFAKPQMKPAETRADQVQWVRKAIAQATDFQMPDILTVSVRYAETEGNTPWALAESGMAAFFDLISEISRTEGVAEKKRTPSQNLNNFVDFVLDDKNAENSSTGILSLKTLRDALEKLRKDLDDAETGLKRNATATSLRVSKRIERLVSEQIDRHANDQNSNGFALACYKFLRDIVEKEILTEVSEIMARRNQAMIALPKIDIPADLPKFEDEYVKVLKSNRGAMGALGGGAGGIGGAWAGGEAGAAIGTLIFPGIGTAIGAVLGGLIGGTVGAAAGAGVGEAAGSDWEESVKSGDNREKVAQTASQILRRDADKAVSQFFAQIIAGTITPPRTRQKNLSAALSRFKTTLENEVRSHD